ncbi:hypothetical protein [Streptococcus infantis]|uniref:hypothetical protein n=1 Tax=Streptococcus infantis TaxID=68892 RepID=UPI0039C113CA
MDSNNNALNIIILLMNSIMVTIILFFYVRNRNREKLKNPNFRSIEKIMNKYYSGYFFKFQDLEYYPKLKIIYRNLLYEFDQEGIYLETLEEYIKIENKTSYLKNSIAVVIAFFGGQELDKLLSNFKNIHEYFSKENFNNLLKQPSQILSEPEKLNQIFLFLASVILILFSILFFFIILFLDNRHFIKKYSLKKQGKHIIEDVITYSKNNKNIGDLNSNDFVFTDENICLLNIGIIKIEEMFTITFPKNFTSIGKKLVYNIENNTNRIEIPGIIFNNQKYTFVFKRRSKNSTPCLIDVKTPNGISISTEKIKKLITIFEILFLGAEIEYNKITFFEKVLLKFTANNDNPTLGSKVFKVLKCIAFIVVFILLFILVIIVGIFIIGNYLFYILLFIYFLFRLAHYIVKKLFS